MIARLFLCSFLLLAHASIARNLSGTVVDNNGDAVPFVNIQWEGSNLGTASSEDGKFTIEGIPSEAGVLLFSSLGYQRLRFKVAFGEAALDIGTVVLQDDMLGLDEVVITGTMRETFIKASPIKVEVITAKRLQNNLPATNLMDGLQLVNGVQEVTSCGVCFTNSISINGLPGPYTAVLMDGTPMYGNLASVYGLNGIPTQMVDRFEVVKGPSSTLYGSEAIAGVINIITKDPGDEPLLAVDLMGTSHQEAFGNVALATRTGKWKAFSGVNFTYMDRYEDENGDGFGDMIGMDRLSLFSKWSLDRPDHRRFTIAAKLYTEDRRNGVEDFFVNRNYRTLRGSDSIYGESIYTVRGEVFGTYDLPLDENVRLDYSMSWHDQDSYYGSDHYIAQQGIAFSNLVWTKKKNRHLLTAGWTNRYQFYDDNTVATNEDLANHPERQYIPGVFGETEWRGNAMWTLLGGMRIDHYEGHGIIPSPRASIKINPSEWTTLRLSSGTGFKIVNLFTEDHAFITGQRTVEIEERLDPERSWNVSANLNHIHALWNSSGMFDVDVYYTRFTNKIVPDYDQPGKIIYSNANGFAESYGLAMTFNQQFTFPLAYSIGMSMNRALTTESENGEVHKELIPFAPLWSGVLTINYNWSKLQLNLAYTATVTGQMTLPEVYDIDENGVQSTTPRPTQSDPFVFQNIQVTKKFRHKPIEVYGGVQNLFNYRQQDSPLVGYNDPNYRPGFSPFFDTSYSYAPMHGREVFLGLRFDLAHSSKK